MTDYEPSPVPGDAHLWPGELPFTAWGRHEPGYLDLRVFDQDVWWVDYHQVPHRLAAITDEYVANIIRHLEDNCEMHYLDTVRRALIQEYGDTLLGRTNADRVAQELGAPALSALTPTEWLESTPLMRALRRRLRDRAESGER